VFVRGGGLGLGSAVVLSLTSFCCCASEGQSPKSELTREMYQHSWRAHLSETWKCADVKQKTWWKASQYEDSIFDAIPQIVANCVTDNTEFFSKAKITVSRGAIDIIEFRNATPDMMKYSQANWNALVLANFIYQSLNNDLDVTRDYFTTLNSIYSDLTTYYSQKSFAQQKNPNFMQLIGNAVVDISQYVSSKGVDLVGYISKIKDIDINSRKIKAPHARISKVDLNNSSNSVIASYPENNIVLGENSAFWREYKIKYDSNVRPTEVVSYKNDIDWSMMPIYTIPENVVKYTTDFWNLDKSASSENIKIFELVQGNQWREIIKNELPQKYSLSYLIMPGGKTKEQLDAASLDYFKTKIVNFSQGGADACKLAYRVKNNGEGVNSAAGCLTTIIRSFGDSLKRSNAQVVEYLELSREKKDKIAEFRNLFKLSEDEYSDKILLKALQDNDFIFGDAFNSLFD